MKQNQKGSFDQTEILIKDVLFIMFLKGKVKSR